MPDIKKFWDRGFLTWSEMRRLASAKVSVVAAVLVLITPLYASTVLIAQSQYSYSLPKPANLLILYFASLLYSIASYMVAVGCPRIVRDYDSKYSFVDKCIAQTVSVNSYADSIEKKRNVHYEKVRRGSSHDDYDNDIKKIIQYEIELEAALPKLKGTWEAKNTSSATVRRLVAAVFALSFSLFAWLSFWDAPSRVVSALG